MDDSGLSRREFLAGAFRGRNLALAGTGGAVWAQLVEGQRGPILRRRPPGARAEPEFLATCTKCGQCVEACPYDTLELATAGEESLGTPSFEPRKVPCHMCPDVPCVAACPSGSLVPETAIEDARMGLAVLTDQETCLAFKGLRCEVCYRACPLMGKAIQLEFRPQERTGKHAFFLPVVNSDACTGCGMCEHSCVLEEAAIKVLPPALAQGRLGSNYRFGWEEEPEISRDFTSSDAVQPEEWQDNTSKVLDALDALEDTTTP
ncbi:MAG: ferredoxin-type protein NapG [bacterium]|nr:ferredoxin-type protein NapG [bacterium]